MLRAAFSISEAIDEIVDIDILNMYTHGNATYVVAAATAIVKRLTDVPLSAPDQAAGTWHGASCLVNLTGDAQ
ncbi:hypothetical protein CMQ_5357 [Grosmannia clavigera kw1407]|uniref:Uncharacterized protein n=1 Tax=Grosmannia clavigera (strain kw1407 / UAMH 11150) TaxID=655863 RepID=F0XBI9_GROCL|nr:uncharacterized protein CMQ_5357 [Grosmannia clavigera kw1407]EFX05095.1 hypothetical protein CMQ_5357 [Grosmannia clavigera kw1407]